MLRGKIKQGQGWLGGAILERLARECLSNRMYLSRDLNQVMELVMGYMEKDHSSLEEEPWKD